MARKTTQGTTATLLRDRINATLKSNVVTMGSDPSFKIEKIPTGSLTLDRLLDGGFARGRHTVLVGDFQTCKSLTCYRTIALGQQRGEVGALIDAENVFNGEWFQTVGGDADELVVYPDRSKNGSSKRDANELGNVLRTMIQKGESFAPADIIAIDSIASLLPSEEMEHDLEDGDPRVASLARLMPLLLRMLTTMNDDTAIIWTNQWRDKIARIPGLKSSPGGRAIGFFASTIVEMQAGEKETEAVKVVVKGKEVERKVVRGQWVTCTATKEKTGARPYATRSFLLDFETKMPSLAREIVDLGMEDGIVERVGDNYIIEPLEGDPIKLHGIGRTIKRIEGDDDLREGLVAMIEERTRSLTEVVDGEE